MAKVDDQPRTVFDLSQVIESYIASTETLKTIPLGPYDLPAAVRE